MHMQEFKHSQSIQNKPINESSGTTSQTLQQRGLYN
jgi:hypothetical protein